MDLHLAHLIFKGSVTQTFTTFSDIPAFELQNILNNCPTVRNVDDQAIALSGMLLFMCDVFSHNTKCKLINTLISISVFTIDPQRGLVLCFKLYYNSAFRFLLNTFPMRYAPSLVKQCQRASDNDANNPGTFAQPHFKVIHSICNHKLPGKNVATC